MTGASHEAQLISFFWRVFNFSVFSNFPSFSEKSTYFSSCEKIDRRSVWNRELVCGREKNAVSFRGASLGVLVSFDRCQENRLLFSASFE